MSHDQPYLQAQNKIEPVTNHPRILTTNSRMSADFIRLFVTPFVNGHHPKGGNHGA